MVRIAVDAMGGDYAPTEIIKGSVAAANSVDELEILLIGAEDLIRKEFEILKLPGDRITIIPADETITPEDDPSLAVRRKKKSSMMIALQMAQQGGVEGVLTAGNTGAVMAGSLFYLGRLSGINRPALLTVLPTFKNFGVIVLDVGANMDAKPEHLLQYAVMGKVYATEVLNRNDPQVGLLNVGEEKNKGNNQSKKAYSLFEKWIENFYGNVEARDIFQGVTDVIVCDGFVGNVLLKTSEGLSEGIFSNLRDEFKRKLRYKVGASLLFPAFIKLKNNLDETEYGGAPLIGINGVCIKCHGSSKAKAIKQALLNQVYPFIKNRANEKIKESLNGKIR